MKSRRAKKIKRLLRLPFEWAGIMLGIAVFSNLPRRWMLAVCDFVSAVMYRFDGRGRRCSLANLRVVRGGFKGCGIVPPAEVYNPTDAEEKIIRRSYRNMARTVGHAFWTCRNAIERVKQAGDLVDQHGRRWRGTLAASFLIVHKISFRQ